MFALLRTVIRSAFGAKAVLGKGVEGNVGGVVLFLAFAKAAAERASLSAEQVGLIEDLNGKGKTLSVLLAGGSVAGQIAMQDGPRKDAKAGRAALKDLGIRTVMLTGDNRKTAEAIAARLGVEARAELLPQDKQRIVGENAEERFHGRKGRRRRRSRWFPMTILT